MKISVFLLSSIIFLAGCAPRVGPAYIFHREQPIEIELKSSSFKPDHLMVLKNDSPIILLLKNTDDISHNFILTSSDRDIIFSQDLKPKEPATVSIGFLSPENYTFYCSLHRHRGMGGMLMVE